MSQSGAAPAIMVVGSINVDLVFSTSRLPSGGETLTGASLAELPGGKGANQALAARLLGAEVSLVARVGDDERGLTATANLRHAGVNLDSLVVDATALTGVAAVTVAESGENHIVVSPGANARLGFADVERAAATASGQLDAVLCQLEVPDEALIAAATIRPSLFCINAAPARTLPPAIWARADLVVVNEVERAQLAAALDAFSGLIATTLGAEGAVLTQAGQQLASARPPTVTVVDTTGAGDAFCASLLVALIEGRTHENALLRASAAGALATTQQGAQASLPLARDLDTLSL